MVRPMDRDDQYRRLVRASELVRWEYCRRAWWLQYVRGHEPANPEALARGRQFHRSHRQHLSRADLYQQLAFLSALAGVGILLIAVVLLSFGV